jgi:hypothetical protein
MATFHCVRCDNKITIARVKFISVDGELIPENDQKCGVCKADMTIIPNEIVISDVSFSANKFDSLSDADKKAVLKRRSTMHFNKFMRQQVEQKRNDTIQGIKQKFEQNINRKNIPL